MGLNHYNDDFAKVQRLQQLYKQEASFFSMNKHHFFEDNPDLQTAIKRLEDQTRRNPGGASEKALALFRREENGLTKQQEFKQRLRESREPALEPSLKPLPSSESLKDKRDDLDDSNRLSR